jgi:hypothetical protein
MQVQLTESRDSVMTVHAAERTIPSKQTAAERAPRNERVGRVSKISPTGPRMARPDDRLRRNPPLHRR